MGSAKRLLALVGCLVVVAALAASSAFAGEITGNGRYIAGSPDAPLKGKSECAYSGLDDPDVDPETGEDDFGRTQSWGQIVRFAGPLGGVPGVACNPSKSG